MPGLGVSRGGIVENLRGHERVVQFVWRDTRIWHERIRINSTQLEEKNTNFQFCNCFRRLFGEVRVSGVLLEIKYLLMGGLT